MSILSRISSIVSGDDGEVTEDDHAYGGYDPEEKPMGGDLPEDFPSSASSDHGALNMPHGLDQEPFDQDNVIGMPGISSDVAEVVFMKPRNFEEMPDAIQALRDRKAIILNLTQLDDKESQRAVDFVSGGNFAIDGSQQQLGEAIFLFAPSCVKVTTAKPSELAPPQPAPSPGPSAETPQKQEEPPQFGAPDFPTYNNRNGHHSPPSSFLPEVNSTPFSGNLPPTV